MGNKRSRSGSCLVLLQLLFLGSHQKWQLAGHSWVPKTYSAKAHQVMGWLGAARGSDRSQLPSKFALTCYISACGEVVSK